MVSHGETASFRRIGKNHVLCHKTAGGLRGSGLAFYTPSQVLWGKVPAFCKHKVAPGRCLDLDRDLQYITQTPQPQILLGFGSPLDGHVNARRSSGCVPLLCEPWYLACQANITLFRQSDLGVKLKMNQLRQENKEGN